MRRFIYCLFAVSFFVTSAGTLAATKPSWDAYNRLLNTHVSTGKLNGVTLNLVDYAAIKNDPDFAAALVQIEQFNTALLTSEKEKLAFYINAYNLLAVKLIVENYPVDSIRDIDKTFGFVRVWKKTAGILNGQAISLHQIEHDILRKLNEPRIHFAIVCASVSCPDLRKEAFTAEHLDRQLEEQTRHFLNNPDKGVAISKGAMRVSKIFDWFEGDFENVGGVQGFIQTHIKGETPTQISGYLNYDWTLNQKTDTQ